MTGSIQQKNGKYYAVINLTDIYGKRKQKWINTGYEIKGNKKKAEKFLREKLDEYETQNGIIESNMLFSEFMVYWIENTKMSIETSTYNSYLDIIKTHIVPYFQEKHIKLIDLSSNDIQCYINNMFSNGRIDGKGGLSAKTVKYHSVLIKKALKYAVKENMILKNPAEFITLPKIQKYVAEYYNEKQITDLFSAIQNEELYNLIYFTVLFGFRRSEVLGLRWRCIDFENKSLTVNHTVVNYKGVIRKDNTKNKSSNRTYPLSTDVINRLLLIKQNETENKMLFGNEYVNNDYIFKSANGEPYRPDFITKKFGDLLKKYNLPHITFHGLRHSCASLLLSNGYQIKDIQEWLGHADIGTTANIYAHLDIERKSKIADAMSNSFKF